MGAGRGLAGRCRVWGRLLTLEVSQVNAGSHFNICLTTTERFRSTVIGCPCAMLLVMGCAGYITYPKVLGSGDC